MYDQLQKLVTTSQLPDVIVEQAKAAFNLITYLGTAQPPRIGEAQVLYDGLRSLAKTNQNLDMFIAQAKAAINMTGYLGNQSESALALYREVQALAATTQSLVILTQQPKAAYNLIRRYVDAKLENKGFELLLKELLPLAEAQNSSAIWREATRSIGYLWLAMDGEFPKQKLALEDKYLDSLAKYGQEEEWQKDHSYSPMLEVAGFIRDSRSDSN